MSEIRMFDDTHADVIRWGAERDLYKQSSAQQQMVKLTEEVGELAADIARGRPVIDSIGDIMVVLTHIGAFHGVGLEACYAHAYKQIEHRKGRFVDGVFVKEEDL